MDISQKPIFQNGHLPECTFGGMDIYPKNYFPELTLARMYIWPKLHFPESLFSRNYTHLPEILLLIEFTLRKHMIVLDLYAVFSTSKVLNGHGPEPVNGAKSSVKN